MYNPGKLRDFVTKVASSGPHLTFYERSAITRAGFTTWLSARAPRSDSKTFFNLHLYLAGRCCENPQSTKDNAQMQIRPGNNMVSKRNHLMNHFSITIHPHLASIYETKYFKSKLARENADWAKNWIWIKESWVPGSTCTPMTS